MAIGETARLLASLELQDKGFSRGLQSASRNVSGLEKTLSKVGSQASRGLGNAVKNVERFGVLAGTAAAGGLAAAVHMAGDFEAQLNTINTVAMTTPAELEKIGQGIRKLATTTGTSTDDLTSAYYDLVSAGIKTADAQNVLTAANTLAIGALGTTSETVDLLTTAINGYNLKASDATKVSNYFAEAVAVGKTKVSDIAGSFAQVGSIAASAGIGLDELAAGFGQLTSKGVPAAEAATDMRAAIVALLKPNASMLALQKKTKEDFADTASEQGLAVAYQHITAAAEKYGYSLPKLTGRIEGTNYALMVTGDNAASYADVLDKVQSSSEGAGVAQEQAAERMKGFNFQMDRLKALAKDAGITIGQALLPTVTDLVTQLNTELAKPETQAKIKQFATDLATGLKEVITELKKVDWGSVVNALKTGAGFARDLIQAFVGAPAWLQTAVLSGWGLNKLTGGAVADIFGTLASGLIKGVLGMNAGIVNITAGTVTGVGGGLPGAGGGGGIGTLGKVGLLAEGAVLVALVANQFNELEKLTAAASAAVEEKVAGLKDNTLTQSLSEIAGLGDTINANSQDLIKAVFMQTGTGRKETIDAFKGLEANIQKTAQTPAERAAAVSALDALAHTIADKYTITKPDADALYAQLKGIYGELQSPPPPPPPTGPTTVVPGPGFTAWMHSQQAEGEAQMRAAAKVSAFADHWKELRDALDKQGETGTKLRHDLAKGLGVTVDQLRELRHVAARDIAGQLGISVAELRRARHQAAGDDAKLAAKLGISVEQLQIIRQHGRETAANTLGILNKPTTVNVSVSTSISGRTIANANYRERITTGKRVD